MQYRTPGLTVTIEESSGHSRIGCAGWEDFHEAEPLQFALSPLVQGGGAAGVSMRRS